MRSGVGPRHCLSLMPAPALDLTKPLGVRIAPAVPCLLGIPLCVAERFLLSCTCLATREETRVFEPRLHARNGKGVISCHPTEKQGFAVPRGILALRGQGQQAAEESVRPALPDLGYPVVWHTERSLSRRP